ncbi:peptidylprolyl isomerase [uncultured Polaribacter sp.]|uniref:peptidylprolyl isomerase n=1 Tax=uncultured Polaribacter sp. TaxID=174711 RepID=UPI00261C1158|nr:peptidylprolyl isomerase [uncultured Polaribacter sp.]
MQKFFYLFLIIALLLSCTPTAYKDLEEGLYAEITTNKGSILLELYADDVPKTVANFVALVEGTNNRLPDSLKGENFYEGIIFHRVVPNFVIQGGGFTPEGRKKPGFLFGDEFPKDSLGNIIYKHDDQGVLSMANGGPTTNNSQFFITHRAIPHLDGKHSVFGKTIVNSKVFKKLKKRYSDSLQLKKAIDSTRMAIVNRIVQNDTIETIKIIRIGSKAEDFNAAAIFDREVANFNKSKEDEIKQEKQAEERRYAKYLEDKKAFLAEMNEGNALKTDSGLRILKLKETKGKKVVANKPLSVNYTIYVADGKKIQSTEDGGQPLVCQLDDKARPMITGFKEGVLRLREGEKARLFIPYYIGFGEEKNGPFPAKADLVFEVEILKVGK